MLPRKRFNKLVSDVDYFHKLRRLKQQYLYKLRINPNQNQDHQTEEKYKSPTKDDSTKDKQYYSKLKMIEFKFEGQTAR